VTTPLVLAAVGAGCGLVAAWMVAAVLGPRAARHRWAAGAAVASFLLALMAARYDVPDGDASYVVIAAVAAWDWWQTRSPRRRRWALVGAAP